MFMCLEDFCNFGVLSSIPLNSLIKFRTDAFEMILCGAAAVQVGTCHWTEGPKCFDRICQELKDIMERKGYNSIDDFKNQLKEWSKEGVALSREAKMKKKNLEKESAVGGGIAVKKSSGGADGQIVTAVLAVVVAVLLADKLNIISI
jgi:dihydroorotate dehydrogenase (fumarate)